MRSTERELVTRNGGPSKGARNVDVALLQGRVTPPQADEFRNLYETQDYEVVTEALLALPPKRDVAPAPSPSEQQWLAYARATNVYPPSGYHRSVV